MTPVLGWYALEAAVYGSWLALLPAALALASLIAARHCSNDRDRAALTLVAQGEQVPSLDEWLPTAIVGAAISSGTAILIAYFAQQ